MPPPSGVTINNGRDAGGAFGFGGKWLCHASSASFNFARASGVVDAVRMSWLSLLRLKSAISSAMHVRIGRRERPAKKNNALPQKIHDAPANAKTAPVPRSPAKTIGLIENSTSRTIDANPAPTTIQRVNGILSIAAGLDGSGSLSISSGANIACRALIIRLASS